MSYVRPIDMLEHEMRDRLAAKDDEIARLRAELAEAERVGCVVCGGQDKHDKLFNNWRAAEDAASRLGKKWKAAVDEIAESERWKDDARKELHDRAVRLAENATEIVRLRKLLAWMVEWFGDDDPTAQVVIDSRAALAPHPEGKGE